jgi:hypothetical protein
MWGTVIPSAGEMSLVRANQVGTTTATTNGSAATERRCRTTILIVAGDPAYA